MHHYWFKHISLVALLGVAFGISEWFYSILGVVYALTGFQNPSFVYITWAGLPTIIVIYESVRTRRALLAYIAANLFLITAVLGYYASYVFDVLFLNSNELLQGLHYTTLDWTQFSGFVISDIGSNIVEWTTISLALGLVLGLLARIIVAVLAYVDTSRNAS